MTNTELNNYFEGNEMARYQTHSMALPIVPVSEMATVTEHLIPDNKQYDCQRLVSCVQNNTPVTMGNSCLLSPDLG